MGAAESTPGASGGLITVSAGAQPKPVGDEALLLHLNDLKARAPRVGERQDRNADPEAVFKDLQSVNAHTRDTQPLSEAVNALAKEWKGEQDEVGQIMANQAHCNRLIDQGQIKAARAMAHVKLQASRLKTLDQQLKVVQGLPSQLQELCSQTQRLQQALLRLQQQHAARDRPAGQPQQPA